MENNLDGTLTVELNHFSKLTALNLYYNSLRGSIPDLSHMVALEQLDLDGNKLTGNAPHSLFNLPNMMNLFLLQNRDLTGTIPEIQSGSRLEKISLYDCSFVGSIPRSLGSVTTLKFIQLKGNAFTVSIKPWYFFH